MNQMRRRTFVALGAASAVAGNAIASTTANRVTVAVIGLGGQGRAHVDSWKSMPDVQLKYLCDVDSSRLEQASALVPTATKVSDMRRVFDDPSVDAVSIATPDHWHVPAVLAALDAGKHVYVEKPCSHNLREGRWLTQAVTRSGKLLQHGTQSRSSPFIQSAMQQLQSGVIGDVVIARAWDVQYRDTIGSAKPSEPPRGIDYDAWLGPSPWVPYQSNRHHYNWHWWYDFGTGDAGNDGVHEIDIARWGLGVSTQPSRVAAMGGKYVHQDDQQFPDTMTAVFEYPAADAKGRSKQLIFEMRLWSRYRPENIDNGNEFLGTKGRMLLTKRGKVELFNEKGERLNLELPKVERVSVAAHHTNFLQAIRGTGTLNADAMTGHLSSSLPHLANAACRAGKSFRFDPQTELADDQEINRLLGRQYREYWATPTAGAGS